MGRCGGPAGSRAAAPCDAQSELRWRSRREVRTLIRRPKHSIFSSPTAHRTKPARKRSSTLGSLIGTSLARIRWHESYRDCILGSLGPRGTREGFDAYGLEKLSDHCAMDRCPYNYCRRRRFRHVLLVQARTCDSPTRHVAFARTSSSAHPCRMADRRLRHSSPELSKSGLYLVAMKCLPGLCGGYCEISSRSADTSCGETPTWASRSLR